MKSKSVDITINKDAVYLKVRRHSSYLGGKDVYTGDASDYDRISAAEADSVMLDDLWVKAVPLLVSQVQRYLFGHDRVTETSDSITMRLTMPLAFRVEDNKPLLVEAFEAFLSVAILVKWLEIANAQDDAKQLTEELKGHTLAIKDILARREMPVRFFPPVGECVEITVEESL